MTVPALPDFLGIDDLLSVLGLIHSAEFELISSVTVRHGHKELVTLMFSDCLVEARKKMLCF